MRGVEEVGLPLLPLLLQSLGALAVIIVIVLSLEVAAKEDCPYGLKCPLYWNQHFKPMNDDLTNSCGWLVVLVLLSLHTDLPVKPLGN